MEGPSQAVHFLQPPDRALVLVLQEMAADLKRLADALAPESSDIVGSRYLAQKLGVTTIWIADMARNGVIPRGCIVSGTGNGRVWKFYRSKIDKWLAQGRPSSI